MPTQITIPDVPDGDCCLWQFDKTFKGDREAKYDAEYDCETGTMRRAKMTISLLLRSTNTPCDQAASKELIPNSSVFEADGVFRQRDDGLAHFTGPFKIKGKDGKELFRGTIELMDRIGSHHQVGDCEECDQRAHLEGWLAGSSSKHTNVTLRGMIALSGKAPTKNAPRKTLSGIINGVLIACT